MKSDLITWLLNMTLIISITFICIAILRNLIRKIVGVGIAYRVWLSIPLVFLIGLIPNIKNKQNMEYAIDPVMAIVKYPTLTVSVKETNMDAIVIGIWMIGMSIMLIGFFIQHRKYLKDIGVLRKKNEIYFSENSNISPALVGVFYPKIIVPENFESHYSQEEQRLIIEHENTHRVKGDHLLNMFYAFMQITFWFNPLIHFFISNFRNDQELACDADVVKSNKNQSRIYAEALLKTQMTQMNSLFSNQLNSYQPIKERIMYLQKKRPSTAKKILGGAIISMIMGMSVFGAWANTQKEAQKTSTSQHSITDELNDTRSITLATKITIDGNTINPKVVVQNGKLAKVIIGEKEQKWELEMMPIIVTEELVRVAIKIKNESASFNFDEKMKIGKVSEISVNHPKPNLKLDITVLPTIN